MSPGRLSRSGSGSSGVIYKTGAGAFSIPANHHAGNHPVPTAVGRGRSSVLVQEAPVAILFTIHIAQRLITGKLGIRQIAVIIVLPLLSFCGSSGMGGSCRLTSDISRSYIQREGILTVIRIQNRKDIGSGTGNYQKTNDNLGYFV